jgi:ParB-like nuclease domain
MTYAGFNPAATLTNLVCIPNQWNQAMSQDLTFYLENLDTLDPILIDNCNRVVDGHHRIIAALRLGRVTIPAIIVEHTYDLANWTTPWTPDA